MASLKVCRDCGEEKPITDFYFYKKKNDKKGGLTPNCKNCRYYYQEFKKTGITREDFNIRQAERVRFKEQGLKRCPTCEHDAVKPVEEFPKKWDSRRQKYQIEYQCKECRTKRLRRYNQLPKTREEIQARREYNRMHWKKRAAENSVEFRATKAAKRVRYRASKYQRTPKWLTKEHHKQIRGIYREAVVIQDRTGVKRHVHHIIPLRGKLVSGLHVPWNLAIVTVDEHHELHRQILKEELSRLRE